MAARKAMFSEVQAGEALFERILEAAPDGVVVHDRAGRIVFANDRMGSLFGYEREELLERDVGELLPAADRGRRKDGSELAVEVSEATIETEEDPLFVSLVRDVTTRVQREERARASEERLRILLQQASDGIFIADLDGRYTDVNEAGCRMLGYTRNELVGKTIADLIPAEDLERLWKVREELLPGGVNLGEWTLERKDGTALPVEVSARILADGRWQAIVRDISERKRAEAARAKAELRLAEILEAAPDAVVVADRAGRIVLVNEQTRALFGYQRDELLGREVEQLLPERLRSRHVNHRAAYVAAPETRAMGVGLGLVGRRKDTSEFAVDVSLATIETEDGPLALAFVRDTTQRERQERAEREFIVNAAHELRTPLAGIAGAVEALQLGAIDIPEKRMRFLEGIARETARLTGLVQALLMLARLQSDPDSIAREQVELAPLLVETARRLELAPGVVAEVDCPPRLAVWAFRPLLEASLGNLAQNASRHTGRGSITLRAARARPGTATIEVRDTGHGIRPEIQSRIFERFYRGSEDRDGFGLGLPLVQEMVRALGGDVELESQPGVGTTVRMTLEEAP